VCKRAQKRNGGGKEKKKMYDSRQKIGLLGVLAFKIKPLRDTVEKKDQTFANFQKTTDRCRRSPPLSLAPFKSENHTNGEF
jgi:hypothetical protein